MSLPLFDDVTSSSWRNDVTDRSHHSAAATTSLSTTTTTTSSYLGADITSQPSAARYVFNNPATAGVRTVITAAYITTFIIGVVGNALVIYVLTALGLGGVSGSGGGSTAASRHAGGVASAAGLTAMQSGTAAGDPFRTVVVRTKSVANCYIANLAIADMAFVCTLPLSCWATYVTDWPFGTVACKSAYAVREINKFVGVYVLVALSVDRYLASHYDLGRWRTLNVGRVACLAIWISSAVATTPYWMYAQVADGRSKRSCRMFWPPDVRSDTPSSSASGAPSVAILLPVSPQQRSTSSFSPSVHVWTRFQLVAGFVVPFGIIVAAYSALGVRLRRLLAARSATGSAAARADGIVLTAGRPGTSCSNRKKNRNRNDPSGVKRPGRAMTRMMVVVTVAFVVTQLPYHVVEILHALKAEQLHNRAVNHAQQLQQQQQQQAPVECNSSDVTTEFSVGGPTAWRVSMVTLSPATDFELSAVVWVSAVVKMLQFVSSCLNPIIYGLMNRNYRALYAEALNRHCPLCYCCCCCSGFNLVVRRRCRLTLTETAVCGRHATDSGGGPRSEVPAQSGGHDKETGTRLERQSGHGSRHSRRRRLLLDVEYCRGGAGWDTGGDGANRRRNIMQRDSVSTSPGFGRTSTCIVTTVSCVELTRVESSLAVHVPVTEAQQEHQL